MPLMKLCLRMQTTMEHMKWERNSRRLEESNYNVRSAFQTHVIYEDLIFTEDTVVGRWTASATHSGNLPGLAPTGKQ